VEFRILIHDLNDRVRELTLKKPVSLIGRGLRCDARLRGDIVSSRHAKLKRYREYAIIEDLDSLNGVFVNGKRIEGQTRVTTGDVIELGSGGPTLKIVAGLSAADAGQRSHATGARRQPSRDYGTVAAQRRSINRWWVIAGAGLLMCLTAMFVVVAILTGYFATSVLDSGSRSLDAEVIFEKYSDSTFLVCLRAEEYSRLIPIGTAFAIEEDGLCATNAHVVNGMKKQQQELQSTLLADKKSDAVELLLISPGGDREYQVVDSLSHRFYSEEGSEFGPDVGVIKVQLRGSEKLTPVPLATTRELRQLSAGEELCCIGYPVFDARRDYNRLSRIAPRIFQGTLVRMLNYHKETSPFENSLLVEHSLDTVGGASGSAIFDSSEKVVALLNAGMVVLDYKTGKVKIEERINYGIRVDALREVVEEYHAQHPD
jgi:hypothetical protein